jgi:iron complex outermembrane receptor protein
MNTLPRKTTNEMLCNQGHGALPVLIVAAICFPALALSQTRDERGDKRILEEVIVTAQKREERLRDVPISITALSGADLDRSSLTGVHEILSHVPGVALSRDPDTNGMQLSLRGVTAANGKFAGATPIAYYVDAIPFGFVRTALVPDLAGYDLDRIEVLRGPQGTLYGAGGVNGVVRVLTQEANLDRYEFKARTALSSMSEGGTGYRGDAALNIPIIEDKLAVRAVAGYQQIPGWIDRANYTFGSFLATNTLDGPVTEKDINEGDQRNLRLKIKAKPTERLSIGLSAWNSRNRYDASQIGDNKNHTPAVRPEPNNSELDAYSLKVDYDFAAFSLSSMSSYVDYSSSSVTASLYDFFGNNVTFDSYLSSEVYSQEVVLNSRQEGPWRWSAGVFYRNAEDVTDQYFGPRLDYFSDFSEQSAIFGEVGRRFWNDQWEWSLGLRYFQDDVGMRSEDNTIAGQDAAPLGRIEDSFNATTPRAVLTWHPTSNLMVYGTYGQGFRSGAQQTALVFDIAPQFPPVKPDKLNNYEVGAKGDLWGDLLTFETALYYIDWKDTQQSVNAEVPGAPGIFALVLVNASSVSGLGMDVALTFRPLKGLEIGASYSANDLTFDKDVFSGNSLLFGKGDRLGNSPKYTINPFVAYSFPLSASGYQGRFSADATYTSPLNTKKLGDPNGVDGEAITLVHAGFSVQAPQHWNVSLNVDNLTNYQKSPSLLSNIAVVQYFAYRERPRTVNLQFEYQF